MVVADNYKHAAMRRGPIGVAVLERVAGPVDARALAVPEREHALDLARRVALDLLRAEDRGRGEVLVDRRLEADARDVEMLRGLPELLVDPAERRAAVPETKPAVSSPNLRSAAACSSISRTSACVPLMNSRPSDRA
jgi:hypothetical protein